MVCMHTLIGTVLVSFSMALPYWFSNPKHTDWLDWLASESQVLPIPVSQHQGTGVSRFFNGCWEPESSPSACTIGTLLNELSSRLCLLRTLRLAQNF